MQHYFLKSSVGIFFLIALLLQSCSIDKGLTPEPESADSTINNAAYGSDIKQMMDVYLPKGRASNTTKVILLIHGGAWKEGDKAEMRSFIPSIKNLWPEAAIINLNYRLADGSRIIHEQISEDLIDAVRFIGSKSAEWKISRNMAIIGASAGAHLALLYTYKFNDLNYVKAVSNIYGPSYFADYEYYNSFNIFLGGNVKELFKNYTGTYWNDSLYKSLSPYNLVNSTNYKPTITFHGTWDLIVPLYNSQRFHGLLDSLGLANEYYQYEAQGHGFDTVHIKDCMQKTILFFKSKM